MTLLEAIDLRRSRRKYLSDPIPPDMAESLIALADEYSKSGGMRMELVFSDGAAFNGLRKSYGMFSNVQNYAGLIADENDFSAVERLGYFGELFMLHAVSTGLGTCWVGGSFDRGSCPFQLTGGESVVCVITLGYTPQRDSPREKLIRGVTHLKTKSAEEMTDADSPVPGWFTDGMRAVEKAPSAVNRQPVMFSCREGKVTAGIKDAGSFSMLDLGIAKLHFELGAMFGDGILRGKWDFGNNAEFVYE
ncbi:MAG: nitroreductase [Oscillospiraceae bacterium]|nr:nitroreductase [Oscillospiraceae bacterium]